jgi:nucleoside-diphosphate-sugar epimerase
MKVLVLGASGFIGSAVTHAFVRAGHIVWGQTRSQETADSLFAPAEIIPVVCDPTTKEGKAAWTKVAQQVDAVVDCLAAGGADQALGIFNAFLEAVSGRPKGSPRPTYVYCSGHYVMARGYGGLDAWSDERQPAEAPINKGTIWRTKIEGAVRAEESINGIVVRPACVYGSSGSYFGDYHFKPALEALEAGKTEFESIISDNGKILTIHQDDAADLFVRVAEAAPAARGEVFLAANPSTDNIRDILDAIVRITGLKGWKAKKPSDAYETAWITPLMARPSLGHALTGWQPKRMAVSDGMDVYWMSFVKSEELKKKRQAKL